MKVNRIFKLQYLIASFAFAGCIFTSCNDEVVIGNVNESNYQTSSENLVYITDNQGKNFISSLEFRTECINSYYVNAPQAYSSDVTVRFIYDASVLEEYNAEYKNSYEAVPQESVSFLQETATLKAGETKSSALEVKITSSGDLMSPDKSYVLPLRISIESGDAKLVVEDTKRLLFVRDLTGIPDCSKASGIKVFSCMEVNDTNPLNNLSFTLKESGKPLFDALIIFSANVNFNKETGRVYVYNNENVQALLSNREKYLKPLQDRGMKIILGLLGNHDGSGIANLSDECAKAFAKDIKALCDAYQLDGVFYDDEYSDYGSYNLHQTYPGFVYPGKDACGRLVYEVYKAQPERWNVAYAYSTTYGLPSVDGMQSGEYVQYALHDYGGAADLSSSFPGMPRSNMGLYSQEFAQGRTASESSLRSMREKGYGAHMIFAMDPYRFNFQYTQLPAMQRVAKAFFDEELVWDGVKYPKDWK